mmetsp:Transcript_33720/g.82718  ORF Transcript_33720/g.82718 Transcript_33720/m.82718 type:complete len:82 (+) Transcript_33720:163-408(+)
MSVVALPLRVNGGGVGGGVCDVVAAIVAMLSLRRNGVDGVVGRARGGGTIGDPDGDELCRVSGACGGDAAALKLVSVGKGW